MKLYNLYISKSVITEYLKNSFKLNTRFPEKKNN